MSDTASKLTNAWDEHLASMLSSLPEDRIRQVAERVRAMRGGHGAAPQLLPAA